MIYHVAQQLNDKAGALLEASLLCMSAGQFIDACVGPSGVDSPQTVWPLSIAELMVQEFRELHVKALELGLKDSDPDATLEMIVTVEQFLENVRGALDRARGQA